MLLKDESSRIFENKSLLLKKLIIILNGPINGKASIIEFVISLFPGLKSAA